MLSGTRKRLPRKRPDGVVGGPTDGMLPVDGGGDLRVSRLEWERAAERSREWSLLASSGGVEDASGSYEWCVALREAHHRSGSTPVLIAEDAHGLRAVWPLHFEQTRIAQMIRCRRLVDVSAWFRTHNAILCRVDLDVTVDRMLTYLLGEMDGWDELSVLDLIPGSPSHRALVAAAAAHGLATHEFPSHRSPYLTLPATWEEYLATRTSKFRNSLKRNERNFQSLSELTVEVIRDPDQMLRGFEAMLEIESHSWKEQAASAITSLAWQRHFYQRLVELTAASGALDLTLARSEGRPIAYWFALRHDNRYSLLKHSYDDSKRASSPGKAMCALTMRRLIAEGVAELDFLGADEPWKLEWTDQGRHHVNLLVFRNARYAALRQAVRWFGRVAHRLRGRTGSSRSTPTQTTPAPTVGVGSPPDD